jgi:hypothetical protein
MAEESITRHATTIITIIRIAMRDGLRQESWAERYWGMRLSIRSIQDL